MGLVQEPDTQAAKRKRQDGTATGSAFKAVKRRPEQAEGRDDRLREKFAEDAEDARYSDWAGGVGWGGAVATRRQTLGRS